MLSALADTAAESVLITSQQLRYRADCAYCLPQHRLPDLHHLRRFVSLLLPLYQPSQPCTNKFTSSNAFIVPIVFYLYPETGFRSLEEIDVIFNHASTQPRPWLNVRKIAANEPLWYGKSGTDSFLYEESDWHKKHVRFSDEIKTSDGETTTLQGGNSISPDGGKAYSPSDDGTNRPGDYVDYPSPLRPGTSENPVYSPDAHSDSLSPAPFSRYNSDSISPLGAESRPGSRRPRNESDGGVSSLASRPNSRPGSRRTVDDNTVIGDDEEAAPSPNISRTSVDRYGRMRSPGHGY
jgi:hypothetical protein